MNLVLFISPVELPMNLTWPPFPAIASVKVQLLIIRLARPAILNIGLFGFAVVDENIMFLKQIVLMLSEVYVKALAVPVLLIIAPSSPTKVSACDN